MDTGFSRCRCICSVLPILSAWLCIPSVSGTFQLLAAENIDLSKLPPAATNRIDFNHDIKPILENSCLRCHGPERHKDGLRLDNREAALKGGDDGVDIVVGDSSKSRLIHYVAYLVPDKEMPPVGKGDELSPKQVGLLRAWIDQGAAWDTGPATNVYSFLVTPTVGNTFVRGDTNKFQEHYWEKAGVNGGAEEFDIFEQPRPDTKISLTGHALVNDYQVKLFVDQNSLGFIHSGWEQYRKYYDGNGGFLPLPGASNAPPLTRDLHLDIGKAWIDFGLTVPDWPRMVLGYEYDYRQGEEAITSWGAFGLGLDLRNMAPASKHINEGTHVIKFDLDYDIKGLTIEDSFRGEFYHLDTQYTNEAARSFVKNDTSQNNHYFQGANTFRLEDQFTPWLYGSGGYLYSKLSADATFTNIATFFTSTPFVAAVPNITLEKESHVFNLNALLGPFEGLSVSVGAQTEWTRQRGMGSGTLNTISYTLSSPSTLAVSPATLSSDYDQSSVSEYMTIRYTKIPYTALFAEARCQQERIGQSDSDLQTTGNFVENPTYRSLMSDIRTGFNTSPWRSVSLSAHYRRYEDDNRFDTNQPTEPIGGYPGFLRDQYVLTDEFEGKLVLHPCYWFKPTLTYQHVVTDYREDTNPAFNPTFLTPIGPGGSLLAGRYRADIWSAGATFIPVSRFSLIGVFSYEPTTITTASANSPSIVPYRGSVYSVLGYCTYVLTEATDLSATYSFSDADYDQNNAANGLPVGIHYVQQAVQASLTHRFGKYVSARLQYGHYYYSEPSSGGAPNYTANAIFGMITFRLP